MVSIYRGFSASSPSASLSLPTATRRLLSKSTNVSSRQMRWRRASRVTTSPAFSRRTTRSRNGCSCSFTRFPFFRSSPEREFTWNGPSRKREPRGVCTSRPDLTAQHEQFTECINRRGGLRPNSSYLIRNDLPAHGGFTASSFDPARNERFDARRRQSRDALEKENHHETHYGIRIPDGGLDLDGQRTRTCPGTCVQGSVRLY